MKHTTKQQLDSFLLIGFGLFFCGVGLVIIQESHGPMEVIGIIAIVASAAFFGASIAGRKRKRR